MLGIGIGISVLSSIGGMFAAKKAKKEAEKQERKAAREEAKARAEMKRLKNIYTQLDTSNPYLNMENKFEDLTVNQQQAQFQQNMFQQSQANILDSLKGAAGGGGVAALAQQLAQQGQLASQKAGISIGQQEQQNQMKERSEASRLDTLERKGVLESRRAENEKYTTLLGMSQQETAAYREQKLQAQQAGQDAQASMYQSLGNMGSNIMGSLMPGQG
tara:strand:- start:1092 stop:1742 length:651 start_codon:yes stop_codon:yes gene_type:complete